MGCENIENHNLGNEPRDLDDMRGKYDVAIIVLSGPDEDEEYREYAGALAHFEAELMGRKAVIITAGSRSHLIKDRLVNERDIPEEDIVVENHSYDTSSNAIFTSEMLMRLGFEEQGDVLLITNGYHLPRSEMLFRRYWGSSFKPINAERFLYENRPDSYSLPGDTEPYPYGLDAKNHENELRTRILKFIDGVVFKTIYKYPAGELLMRSLAKSRLQQRKKSSSQINQENLHFSS